LKQELDPRRIILDTADVLNTDDDFKNIWLDLRVCCSLIEDSLEQRRSGLPLSLELLGHCRDIVQHRLLSLPDGRDDIEVVRLATLVFTYGVTYPLPRPEILHNICALLLEALHKPHCVAAHSDELLFWAAMMGALGVGEAKDNGQDFIIYLRRVTTRLGLTRWEDAQPLLKKFVWLSAACDRGARLIWTDIFRSSPVP
jgi:hypothetical protein